MITSRSNRFLAVRTLQDVLLQSAARFGDRPALSLLGGDPVSYRTMLDRARGAASRLASRGVRAGDRVAILGENSPAWGIAYFAVTSMGAVAVPILTDFPAAQVGTIVEHAGCRAVLVSSRLAREARLGAASGRGGGQPEVLDLEEAAAGEGSFDFPPVSSGRPRGHHLHLGHHRPFEGRHADARQHRLERRGDPDHPHDAPRGPPALHPAARSHLRVQPRPRGGPPAGSRGHLPRPAADRLGAAAGPRRGAADRSCSRCRS